MFKARRLVRLLLAALTLTFMAGSAMAGLHCATPIAAESSSTPADCPDAPSAGDCFLFCPPMCAATVERPETVAPFPTLTAGPIATNSVFLRRWHFGPEPPPPRV